MNIALEVLGAVISLLLIYSTPLSFYKKDRQNRHFLYLAVALFILLFADAVAWICTDSPYLRITALITHTISNAMNFVMLMFLMNYLVDYLTARRGIINFIIVFYDTLCLIAIVSVIINFIGGYYFTIGTEGEFVRSNQYIVMRVFTFAALLISVPVVFTCRGLSFVERIYFSTFSLFPLSGLIFDCFFQGLSLFSTGALISTVIIFVNIYMKRMRIIEEQKNALMVSQINPHFIYNALTTVASLCDTDPAAAKDSTIDFATYLRSNFESLRISSPIPFSKELEHVKAYLKVEKVRFGDRLTVEYDIKTENFNLPALTVQPMVENAVRHGIWQSRNGGTLRIETDERDNFYFVKIKDNGVGFDVNEKKSDTRIHVGIENVRDRLSLMSAGELLVESEPGVGTCVTILIPKKKGGEYI